MLEKYVKDFDADAFVKQFQAEHGCTKKQALKLIARGVHEEPYYQKKVKDGIETEYGSEAVVVKIAQGPFSEGGVADLMCVYRGHYFGFEVKRPVVGVPSKLQLAMQERVRYAGGTYEFVSWPEEAVAIIREWEGMHVT